MTSAQVRGVLGPITELAQRNSYFRQEVETGEHTQVVVMNIPAGGEIGMEVHEDTDQILINTAGEGKVILDGQEHPFRQNELVFVQAGTWHNFLNTGNSDLKLVTMYSPPHHKPGTVHRTKADADAAEAAESH